MGSPQVRAVCMSAYECNIVYSQEKNLQRQMYWAGLCTWKSQRKGNEQVSMVDVLDESPVDATHIRHWTAKYRLKFMSVSLTS